ncbi:MAG: glycosyltransferase [Cyanobacteria bacterium NC_groundwater_1444_Ag_S-0.65um_54_12]|nr:glycosyltransferase [Cyanobacteria bacterium NC_groundwater_1444_Ag_S-0.65um_54_12]
MEKPLVTVLLPTFNRPELLVEAINSVGRQTFANWQLWVLNDGGCDITAAVATADTAHVAVFELPHRGKAAALNWAIRRSETPYVAYLDDDDRWLPHHLETMLSVLEASTQYRAAYSAVREVRLRADAEQPKEITSWIDSVPNLRCTDLLFRNVVNHNALVHERSLFAEVGLYDESLPVLIDWDMVRRIARRTRLTHVPVVTVEHRLWLEPTGKFSTRHLTGFYHNNRRSYRRAYWHVLLKSLALL